MSDSSRPGSLAGGSSASTSTTGRRRSIRTSLPDGVQEVVALAKDLFRLKLLTVNAMQPDTAAFLQAKDQIISARVTYSMQTRKSSECLQVRVLTSGEGWPDIDRLTIKKVSRCLLMQYLSDLISPQVVHDGSNIRNEFKTAARQLVVGKYYDIFPLPTLYESPEHVKQHIAHQVGALLNTTTGAWMHNGKDSKVSKSRTATVVGTDIIHRASPTTSSILLWKKSSSAHSSQRRGLLGVATWTNLSRCPSPPLPLRAARYDFSFQ